MNTKSIIPLGIILLTACRVQNPNSEGGYASDLTEPVLQVTPTELNAGVICESAPHEETIYLANTGTELLEIHDLEATGGWKVMSKRGPIYIPIGEQVPVSVQTSTETGMLIITSNDSENPVQQVFLHGDVGKTF